MLFRQLLLLHTRNGWWGLEFSQLRWIYFVCIDEDYLKGMHFAICRSGKPDVEAILLSVRELPLVLAFLEKWAHFLRVILWVPIDQVISANQSTQGNKGRKRHKSNRLIFSQNAILEIFLRFLWNFGKIFRDFVRFNKDLGDFFGFIGISLDFQGFTKLERDL